MRRLMMTFALGGFLLMFPAISSLTADEDPFKLKGLSEKEAKAFYQGVAAGLGAYNSWQRLGPGGSRIAYCPPKDFDGRDVYAAANRAMTGAFTMDVAAVVALAALDEWSTKYPCP